MFQITVPALTPAFVLKRMANLLGLVAGNRSFPIHVARSAKEQGYQVVAVGLREETDPALEREVDRMLWVTFSEIGKVPELLKEAGVQDVLLAGQIRPERLLGDQKKMDGLVQQLMKWMPDFSGASAMKMAVKYLESRGFRVLHSGTFLKSWLPPAGILTARAPSPEERADGEFGLRIARQLAGWKAGQTVVVRRKAVAAIEALEGTDETIRRAGRLAGPGCVVAKACEPDHDMRFDIPVIGMETLKVMQEAQASCIAMEAGRVLLFNRPELVAAADAAGLALVAY